VTMLWAITTTVNRFTSPSITSPGREGDCSELSSVCESMPWGFDLMISRFLYGFCHATVPKDRESLSAKLGRSRH